jgi:prevent-host-death family protein
MTKQVNIHAAKTHFSKLCEEVEAGGEVTIARAGKPILKLVKIEEDKPILRKLGGLSHLADELDEDFWGALNRNANEDINWESLDIPTKSSAE